MLTTDDGLVPNLDDRFWSKVQFTPKCWEWTGAKNRKGYGEFKYLGQARRAHRMAYLGMVGPIPEGWTIDHLCRNKACVNPDHLEAVTNDENMRRSQPYRDPKQECHKGHPYAGENLSVITRSDGRVERRCRACYAENHRRYRRKHADSV